MRKWTQQRYVLMTLDPLHVGTGGTRLGRVDMDIAREPGTRLPKLPGTSLGGAIRQYAAYQAAGLPMVEIARDPRRVIVKKP